MRIHLIRHPCPDVAPGICYGRSDLALAENAMACAARLRPQLQPDAPLFTSPLQRCRDLATLLHTAPVVDERLIEMDFGAWEMRAWDDIPRAEIDAWSTAPLDYAPPGGEPVAALRARVRDFIAEHRHLTELTVVTHAGVMKLFAAELLGLPEREWLALHFDYGGSVVLTG